MRDTETWRQTIALGLLRAAATGSRAADVRAQTAPERASPRTRSSKSRNSVSAVKCTPKRSAASGFDAGRRAGSGGHQRRVQAHTGVPRAASKFATLPAPLPKGSTSLSQRSARSARGFDVESLVRRGRQATDQITHVGFSGSALRANRCVSENARCDEVRIGTSEPTSRSASFARCSRPELRGRTSERATSIAGAVGCAARVRPARRSPSAGSRSVFFEQWVARRATRCAAVPASAPQSQFRSRGRRSPGGCAQDSEEARRCSMASRCAFTCGSRCRRASTRADGGHDRGVIAVAEGAAEFREAAL